ncbi:MAG: hypothetical protein JNN07_29125 [Verrucomicrobiales bacterium]|nr:hypothetical protein [Verrucomicrobiales bacterium]
MEFLLQQVPASNVTSVSPPPEGGTRYGGRTPGSMEFLLQQVPASNDSSVPPPPEAQSMQLSKVTV